MLDSIDKVVQKTPEAELSGLVINLEKIGEFEFPHPMRVGDKFMVHDRRVYSVGLSVASAFNTPQTLNIFDLNGKGQMAQFDLEELQRVKGMATDGNLIYIDVEGNFPLRGSDVLFAKYSDEEEGLEEFSTLKLVNKPLNELQGYQNIIGNVEGMAEDHNISGVVGFFKKDMIQRPTKGSLLRFLDDGRLLIHREIQIMHHFSGTGREVYIGCSDHNQGFGASYSLLDGKLESSGEIPSYGERTKYLELEPNRQGGGISMVVSIIQGEDWETIPLNVTSKEIGIVKGGREVKSTWVESDNVHVLYGGIEQECRNRGAVEVIQPAMIETYHASLKNF